MTYEFIVFFAADKGSRGEIAGWAHASTTGRDYWDARLAAEQLVACVHDVVPVEVIHL